jgi:serine protease Do
MAVLLGWLGVAFADPVQTPTPTTVPTYDPSRSFAPLVEAVSPAVVAIEVQKPDAEAALFQVERIKLGEGSGFLVSAEGLVLTNHHVVTGVTRLAVRMSDGRVIPATVVGADASIDVALLRLEDAGPWPYVVLGTSADVRVGDWVLALGNPLRLGTTVTAGIVSGKGRVLNHDRYYRSDDFLQTDAAINPGNSGGPLFDLNGMVIGMNSQIIAGANTTGFAISADLLREALPDLIERGHVARGFLGVHARELEPAEIVEHSLADGGAWIRVLIADSPAAAAGLEEGDIVLAVEGETVSDPDDLIAAVGSRRPGETVKLTVLRAGERRTIKLTLGEKPPRSASPR